MELLTEFNFFLLQFKLELFDIVCSKREHLGASDIRKRALDSGFFVYESVLLD